MLPVLATFLLVYGAMHWYFYRRLRSALSSGLPRTARFLLLLFLLVMLLTPILVRILEHRGWELAALGLAHLGFGWMGLLFLFSVAALPLDILGRLYRRLTPVPKLLLHGDGLSPAARFLAPAPVFWLAFLVAVAGSAYGYREARDIRLERVEIVSAKLPPGQAPLRIVQVTDIHLGLLIRDQRLRRILEVVAAARPDLLLATGDIVDGQGDNIAPLAAMFKRVVTPLGKFAVLGNHEFYVGESASARFHEEAGFTVLRGEFARINPRLTVAGVDDNAGVRMGVTPSDQEQRLLAELPEESYNILLKHQPELLLPVGLPGGVVDLQLSGHLHGGQILPFKLLTWLAYRVPMGLSGAADGRQLYVGRGSGTWGPPIRFLAPPEVTLFELIPAPPEL